VFGRQQGGGGGRTRDDAVEFTARGRKRAECVWAWSQTEVRSAPGSTAVRLSEAGSEVCGARLLRYVASYLCTSSAAVAHAWVCDFGGYVSRAPLAAHEQA
ncbi:unnamed protein product, partial [Ectocarpus sp. 12 AP-2014]